jgi:hypothetical protein
MTICINLARVKAAELRLAFTCAATCGLYVTHFFIDESRHDKSGAMPDAIYVSYFTTYDETLLYDVRRDCFLTIAWPDWVEAQDAE